MAIGEDFIAFTGCVSPTESKRPHLEMTVVGSGPKVPVPVPTAPRGPPGTIVSTGPNYVDVSCDGGPDSVFDGLVMSSQ